MGVKKKWPFLDIVLASGGCHVADHLTFDPPPLTATIYIYI